MSKVIDCDVLVIGTGAIGATYARCLAGSGRQVTMIDTGPQMRRLPGEHLLNSFRYQHEPNLSIDEAMANHNVFSTVQNYDPAKIPNGAYKPKLERLNFENPNQKADINMPFAGAMYAVGGLFSFWSGFAPIPTKYERTPLIPDQDWERMIDISVKLLNCHTDAFEPSVVNRAIHEALSEPGRAVDNMPMGAQKRALKGSIEGNGTHYVDWTGSNTILGPLLQPDGRTTENLQILEYHRAEELLWSPSAGSRISGVRVRDLRTLETKEYHASIVIVAAGSFGGASLMWNSGIRPPALGHYLCDNPVATGNVYLGDDFVERLRADPDNPARDEVVPIAWTDAPPKSGFVSSADTPWLVHISRTGRAMTFDLINDVRLSVGLTGYSTVEARYENYVEFSDTTKDRFGMPQMTFHYGLTDTDKQLQARALQDIQALGEKIGSFGKMSRPPFEHGASTQPAGTSLHLTGVTRMGADRAESVVGSDCQVWDFDNLYVGGLGVLPECIASNPTFTCCAIAVRSAASILNCSLADLEEQICPSSKYQDPGMPLNRSDQSN